MCLPSVKFRVILWQMLILPSVFFRVIPWLCFCFCLFFLPWQMLLLDFLSFLLSVAMLLLLLILPSVANASASASAFQHQRINIRRSIGIKETIHDASGSERHLFI